MGSKNFSHSFVCHYSCGLTVARSTAARTIHNICIAFDDTGVCTAPTCCVIRHLAYFSAGHVICAIKVHCVESRNSRLRHTRTFSCILTVAFLKSPFGSQPSEVVFASLKFVVALAWRAHFCLAKLYLRSCVLETRLLFSPF